MTVRKYCLQHNPENNNIHDYILLCLITVLAWLLSAYGRGDGHDVACRQLPRGNVNLWSGSDALLLSSPGESLVCGLPGHGQGTLVEVLSSPLYWQGASGVLAPLFLLHQAITPETGSEDRFLLSGAWQVPEHLQASLETLMAKQRVIHAQRGTDMTTRLYLAMAGQRLRVAVRWQPGLSGTGLKAVGDALQDALITAYLQLLDLSGLLEAIPELIATVTAAGGSGDDPGDDSGNNGEWAGSDPEPLVIVDASSPLLAGLLGQCMGQKCRLLAALRQKLQKAIAGGNTNLARVLRDRIMIIEADLSGLERQASEEYSGDVLSALFLRLLQELWVNTEEVQAYYGETEATPVLLQHANMLESLITDINQSPEKPLYYEQWRKTEAGLLYTELKRRLGQLLWDPAASNERAVSLLSQKRLPGDWPVRQRPTGNAQDATNPGQGGQAAATPLSGSTPGSHSGQVTAGQQGQGAGGAGGDENERPAQAESVSKKDLLEQVFAAAASGNVSAIREYLNKGGQANVRNNHNQTLLHVALAHQHLTVAEVLFQYQAGIDDEADSHQQTPLDYAARHSAVFFYRFLMVAYGGHALQGRWQPAQAYVQIKPERQGTPEAGSCDPGEGVIRYWQSQHVTPEQFSRSREFPEFCHQFEDHIEQLRQRTRALFTPQEADRLLQKLDLFKKHVFEDNGNYFSSRIDRVYGEIHENIHAIIRQLESLPDEVQKNAIDQLLDGIDLCIDGVHSRTQDTLAYLGSMTSPEQRWIEACRSLLQALVLERLPHDHPNYLPNNEVHYVNAYLNYLSGSLIHGAGDATWPVDLIRCDQISHTLGITLKQRETFARRASARVDAAQVVHWLTDQAWNKLQALFPPETDMASIAGDQLAGDQLAFLNEWFDSLKIIFPPDLTLSDLVDEHEGHYSFAQAPFRLRLAIARFLSDRLSPSGDAQTLFRLAPRIQTCHHLVYWTGNDGQERLVTFEDLQALLQNQEYPVYDQLVMEVIRSCFSFSRQLYLYTVIFSNSEPDRKERLLKTWYEHILSHKSLREAFIRFVGLASPELLQQFGLLEHYGVLFNHHRVGRQLLQRFTAPETPWIGIAPLKAQLLLDPDVQTAETLEQARDLSQPEKVQLLHRLALQGQTELLCHFLDLGLADVNAIDQSGLSALRAAVTNGHTETVKLLINREAEVNYVNPNNNCSVLMEAVGRGHRDTVELLIDEGADVNFVNLNTAWSVLMNAVERGHRDIVELLINKGAQVNYLHPDSGWSVLRVAAAYGHTAIVKLIIDKGAKVNYVTQKDGWSILMVAVGRGHRDTVELLIDEGADVNFVNLNTGWSVLMKAVSRGHRDIVELLINKGAQVDYVNPNCGWSVLRTAVDNGHTAIVKFLIEKGAEVDDVNQEDGWSVLIKAVYDGHRDIVELLINKGARVNYVNPNNGWSVLIMAAYAGHRDIVELLINKRAQVNYVRSGVSALKMARYHGNDDIAALLIEADAPGHWFWRLVGFVAKLVGF